MMMTDIDLTVLEDMEFAPPCDWSIHQGDDPAEWIVWTEDGECGCTYPVRNFCQRCIDYRAKFSTCRCSQCNSFMSMPKITRMERIDGAS